MTNRVASFSELLYLARSPSVVSYELSSLPERVDSRLRDAEKLRWVAAGFRLAEEELQGAGIELLRRTPYEVMGQPSHATLVVNDGQHAVGDRHSHQSRWYIQYSQYDSHFRKTALLSEAKKAGVPTLPFVITSGCQDVLHDRLRTWGESEVVVQWSYGSGGIGTEVLSKKEALARRYWPTDLIIAPRVTAENIVESVSLATGSSDSSRIFIFEQYVQDFIYSGTRGPLRVERYPDLLAVGKQVRAVLSNHGFRGLFGIDMLRTKKYGLVVVDINPRPTTSIFGLTAVAALTDSICPFIINRSPRPSNAEDILARLHLGRKTAALSGYPLFFYPGYFEYTLSTVSHGEVRP